MVDSYELTREHPPRAGDEPTRFMVASKRDRVNI